MSKRTFTPPLPDANFNPADHAASEAQIKMLIDMISDAGLRARITAELSKPRDLARRTKARFVRRRHLLLLGRRGGMSESGNA